MIQAGRSSFQDLRHALKLSTSRDRVIIFLNTAILMAKHALNFVL